MDRVTVIARTPDLVAVSKPSGVAVVPARGEPAEESLRHRVEGLLGERLWVVHRLDRPTSGVVVFARSGEAHRALSLSFERREAAKVYVAYAGGALPGAGRIGVPLHPARRGKMRPARGREPGRKDAVTDYTVAARWRRAGGWVSKTELRPLTGRQHQIRVHLRWAGAPVLFDPLYGTREVEQTVSDGPCRRLALHATRLELPGHPPLEASLPDELVELERWLEGAWDPVPVEP